jgi:hypothetical protein
VSRAPPLPTDLHFADNFPSTHPPVRSETHPRKFTEEDADSPYSPGSPSRFLLTGGSITLNATQSVEDVQVRWQAREDDSQSWELVPTISKLDAGESACFSGINFSSPGLPEERQPAIGSNITLFLQYRVSFGLFLAFDGDRPDFSLLELMTRFGVLVGSL